MGTKQKLEAFYKMPLEEIIRKIHWENKVSLNEISKYSGVIRQSIMYLCKSHNLELRSIREATRLTKNKGKNHWAWGQTKKTSKLFKRHSERMRNKNPVHNKAALIKITRTKALVYKNNPLTQEILFQKILEPYKVQFVFQYPITPYIIDFFYTQTKLVHRDR
jgi:hypothetical protein